jgi:hypothetical protein
MPMSPNERHELNAMLGNAVDTLQAELEAYRVLLFVTLLESARPTAPGRDLRALFARARQVVESRILTNVSAEEGDRQRRTTLQALDGLIADLEQVERASRIGAANTN